jgi:hypothetical protein
VHVPTFSCWFAGNGKLGGAVGLVRGVSGAMANRHFGKLADVRKHAVLAVVAGCEPPHRYAEAYRGATLPGGGAGNLVFTTLG